MTRKKEYLPATIVSTGILVIVYLYYSGQNDVSASETLNPAATDTPHPIPTEIFTPEPSSTETPTPTLAPTLTLTPNPTAAPEQFLGGIDDCRSLTDRSQITNDQEISWFDGFVSAPSEPDAMTMDCWALQMQAAQSSDLIEQSSNPDITSDVVSWQKIYALTQEHPDLFWSEGPTENLNSGQTIVLSDAKQAGEDFWQEVVRIMAHDTGKSLEDAEKDPDAAIIFDQLIAGVLPGRNTNIVDTCKTHTASADNRGDQPKVQVPAIWRPGVNVGGESNQDGKEQLSNEATLAQVFVTNSPEEAEETRADLKYQKIFFRESILPSGKIVFSIIFDAESEGPNTLGVDANPNKVGDLGQLIPCGVNTPIETSTPKSFPISTPTARPTPQPTSPSTPEITPITPTHTPTLWETIVATATQIIRTLTPTPRATDTPPATFTPPATVTEAPTTTLQPPIYTPTVQNTPHEGTFTPVATGTPSPIPPETPSITPIPPTALPATNTPSAP